MNANDNSGDSGQQAGTLVEPIAPGCAAVLVYATFPSEAAAVEAGRMMVEARLAGCINVLVGMTSIYVWNGKTETASEAVLIAKMPAEAAADAIGFIKAHHAYETPAILVIPVIAGDTAYLAWIRAGTTQAPPA